jgi:hypothetical protein
MSIYWHKTATVGSIEVSAIRDDKDLHAMPGSTGEIMWRQDKGLWQDLWVGPAPKAHDVFKWVVENLKGGVSIDEIDDYILESPEKFR